jgi:hypothetical protein
MRTVTVFATRWMIVWTSLQEIVDVRNGRLAISHLRRATTMAVAFILEMSAKLLWEAITTSIRLLVVVEQPAHGTSFGLKIF